MSGLRGSCRRSEGGRMATALQIMIYPRFVKLREIEVTA